MSGVDQYIVRIYDRYEGGPPYYTVPTDQRSAETLEARAVAAGFRAEVRRADTFAAALRFLETNS